jgi:uncharacterized membrane protein YeaQ/YmgE (transglycosylase-associated protein family)
MNFLWFLLIGACAGWLAGQIFGGSGFGIVRNVIVGVIGAIIGGALVGLVGFTPRNTLGELVSATLGAILLLAILQKFGRRV